MSLKKKKIRCMRGEVGGGMSSNVFFKFPRAEGSIPYLTNKSHGSCMLFLLLLHREAQGSGPALSIL